MSNLIKKTATIPLTNLTPQEIENLKQKLLNSGKEKKKPPQNLANVKVNLKRLTSQEIQNMKSQLLGKNGRPPSQKNQDLQQNLTNVKVNLKRLTSQEIKEINKRLQEEAKGQVKKKAVKRKIVELAKVIQNRFSAKRVDNVLKNIYYTPSNPASYSSARKVYLAAKKKNPNITYSDVEKWLSLQPTYSSFKQTSKNFPRRKVLVRGIKHQFQADLLDVLNYKKSNLGYQYLLTVIDCFSRKADAQPLKTKQGEEVSKAFVKVFKNLGVPRKMQTDRGNEFLNVHVRKLFKKNNIILFHTNQNVKAQMVERFNRTLRDKIKKHISATNSYNFINALPDLLTAYNNSKHSSLQKFSPNEVNKKNEDEVRNILYGNYFKMKLEKPRFKIGDTVLIVQERKAFDKRTPRFGKTRYEITDVVHKHNPPMYRLKKKSDNTAVDRLMYGEELQKVFVELE